MSSKEGTKEERRAARKARKAEEQAEIEKAARKKARKEAKAAAKLEEEQTQLKKKKRKQPEDEEQDTPAKKRRKNETASPGLRRSPRLMAKIPPGTPTRRAAVGTPTRKSPRLLAMNSASMPPIALDLLSPQEFRKSHAMEVLGKDEKQTTPYQCPPPVQTFLEAPYNKEVRAHFLKIGFAAPTPIQAQAWPICLQGRDMISVARTGSGKTLGFLLPSFSWIGKIEAKAGDVKKPVSDTRQSIGGYRGGQRGGFTPSSPLCVVLAPTRELAMQIAEVSAEFGAKFKVRSVCVYGGESKWVQIKKLSMSQPQVVIATPGRLVDLCTMGKIHLSNVHIFVLDEADKMLDMGFEPQLKQIQGFMAPQNRGPSRPLPSSGQWDRESRQTLMFSATWPKSVQKIARDTLHNPVQLNVGNSKELVANESITQEVLVLDESDKFARVSEIIKGLPAGAKILCFMMTKRSCDRVANSLWGEGVNCDSIHGDKMQHERTRILAAFSDGSVPILFATDVAARGLDVKDVTHVINYDFPKPKGKQGIEDFVHRIGRTGRGGAKGDAITFLTNGDRFHAPELIGLLERAKQKIPEALTRLAAKAGGGGRGSGRRWQGGGGGRSSGRGRGGGGGRGRRW